jgi:hypothetical protein
MVRFGGGAGDVLPSIEDRCSYPLASSGNGSGSGFSSGGVDLSLESGLGLGDGARFKSANAAVAVWNLAARANMPLIRAFAVVPGAEECMFECDCVDAGGVTGTCWKDGARTSSGEGESDGECNGDCRPDARPGEPGGPSPLNPCPMGGDNAGDSAGEGGAAPGMKTGFSETTTSSMLEGMRTPLRFESFSCR